MNYGYSNSVNYKKYSKLRKFPLSTSGTRYLYVDDRNDTDNTDNANNTKVILVKEVVKSPDCVTTKTNCC